jgi:hypothetical protein
MTFSQQLPSFQWAQEVDASGADSVRRQRRTGRYRARTVYVPGAVFKLPAVAPVVMLINGVNSQAGIVISIRQ